MMKNTRMLGSLGLSALLAVMAGCRAGDAESKKPPSRAVPVTVASVTERVVPVTLRASGAVEAIASVSVVSRVDGPIVKVFVKDGQEVEAGDPLVQIDPEPLRIQVRVAEANLARDRAVLADANAKEQRGRALLEQHYISSDEYQQLKSTMDSAGATVKADEAALDSAHLQLGYSTVRAPMGGKIGHIALQPGNLVRAAAPEPLTTLNALDTVDVSFAVPEQNLAMIRRALDAKSTTVTIAAATTQTHDLTGEVSFVDNAIDRTSGTIRLRARFDNRERLLWPGQFIAVSLALGTTEPAIVIPAVAIAEGPDGPYVFVVKNDSAVEQRQVKVFRVAGDDALVSGVKPGERVVVDGQSRLSSGAQVRIREQAASA
jgi:multidrug efflux system membrane fusion protein